MALRNIQEVLTGDWVSYRPVALADVAGGLAGTVAEVRAASPVDQALLTARGLIPGARIVVESASDEAGELIVRIGDQRMALERRLSQLVFLARPTPAREVASAFAPRR